MKLTKLLSELVRFNGSQLMMVQDSNDPDNAVPLTTAMMSRGGTDTGGTVTPFTPNTFAGWQPASSSNLLIGYTFVGDIHYAAVHKRVLTAQEMADMVAYARSICTARGVKI